MNFRFPDKDVGQFPMAYVVRKKGSNLTEKGVMDFISKQVIVLYEISCVNFGYYEPIPSTYTKINMNDRDRWLLTRE